MLKRILQPFERLRPLRDLIERRRTPDIAELAVVLEVRFDEVATSCRGYDFGRAATEELRDAQGVVVVAVGAYDDVFELSGWVEGMIVVVWDGAVLEVGAEVDVFVYLSLSVNHHMLQNHSCLVFRAICFTARIRATGTRVGGG